MPLPSKREPEQLRQALEGWFNLHLPSPVVVGPVSIPSGTGMSSETLLFDLRHTTSGLTEQLVARVRPDMDDWPVFPEYDLQRQAQAMRLVGEVTTVPVPDVPYIEPDETYLGAPFIVMQRVRGSALPDMPPYVFGGSELDTMSPDDRRLLQREAVSVLARIHAIDISRHDVTFIAPAGGDALGRQLAEQRAYYEWAAGGVRVPIVERALDWLAAHRPNDPGPTVVNWGDARPGNILFDATRPTAVLDWEMVNLGPAAVDVGWFVFMHQFFQSLATTFELPGFPDFCRSDDVIADYADAGGVPITDLDWYVAFASTRFASISLRTSNREVAYGNRDAPSDPEELLMHRALLAEHIGEA
jgi:aminoglycoside phosphotransferase (APT) family kinase protein